MSVDWMAMYFTSKSKRRQPKEGDRKVDKAGVAWIRKQVYSERERAYLVSNGKPVFEWIKLEATP